MIRIASALNQVLRWCRTIWNHVADEASEDEAFPANFTRSVLWHTGQKPGFKDRAQDPIPWRQLPYWRIAIEQLTPKRRDYNLIVILTGLRRTDCATIRWEHLNLETEPVVRRIWDVPSQAFIEKEIEPETMIRPMPKGGAKKAFFVPLTPFMIEILRRRREENRALPGGDGGWVFPSMPTKSAECDECADLGLGGHERGTMAHIVDVRKSLVAVPGPDGTPILFEIRSPHRLRDTYSTAGEQAGVPDGVVKRLMNHKFELGDVTARYRRQDLEFLRECQSRIGEFLLARMAPPPAAPHSKATYVGSGHGTGEEGSHASPVEQAAE